MLTTDRAREVLASAEALGAPQSLRRFLTSTEAEDVEHQMLNARWGDTFNAIVRRIAAREE